MARIEQAVDVDLVRGLWDEYWQELGVTRDFQGFEEEWRTLPGAYAPPGGRLLLAWVDERAVGTIALRPIDTERCEAKRLYVRREFRGQGIAQALLARVFDEARAAGYRRVCGDTLKTMTGALQLYRNLGFHETDPYSEKPTPGAIYLQMDLT